MAWFNTDVGKGHFLRKAKNLSVLETASTVGRRKPTTLSVVPVACLTL